ASYHFVAVLLPIFRPFHPPARSPISPRSLHDALPICRSAAEAGLIANTSTILRPFRVAPSARSLKRLPPQASHSVRTSSRKARSVTTIPLPLHRGHAPRALALNHEGCTPFTRAKSIRIGSATPSTVAGVERMPPCRGAWPTTTKSGCWRGSSSATSVLFPDPATPLTTVRTPRGTSTVMSRRLWLRALV